ncbi:aminopeptidase M1-D-like isoform X3 [Ooceraea biroi]|nr:aminopeptidase M1-D-like isoform X2 [Ooceraea biroi]XP_026825011.1 aminopeptidase M1-D-like isoform X3 [Ooceraea biroi]
MVYEPINKTHSKEENVLDLYFKDRLSPGNYNLSIPYDKIISPYNTEEEGYLKILFESNHHHRTQAHKDRLLATNIQSIEARQWFPCWDEPEFKTTFHFRFNHYKKYKIWPILPDVHQKQWKDRFKQDWFWTCFNISTPISAYQVMFILTDLFLITDYISRPTSNRTDKAHRTIGSRPIMENFMNFSDVVIDKISESQWYRTIPVNVLNINYLAIPAMKEDVIGTWRLLLYKVSLVTCNEERDSSAHKREVARTIVRGTVNLLDNAITPSWWSHLWFSKGLAALLHVEILNEIFPKWRSSDLFVVEVQQDCLHLDTQFTMKPLLYEVQTSSEIKSLFSFPIYVKAPVILRVIKHILGDKFQQIIKKYRNT